jgi:hypothetical protein
MYETSDKKTVYHRLFSLLTNTFFYEKFEKNV